MSAYNAAKTQCHRGHALDRMYADGKRSCSTCDRIRQRLANGWTLEEALNTPPVPHGVKTKRRTIGTRAVGNS